MITLTDTAAAKVKSLIDEEGEADLALRVAVRPGGCSGFSYEMFFDSETEKDDLTTEYGPGVKVVVDGRDSGTGVDAMAGESSGRLAYLVVSEGGVAGLGERFRRIPWALARVEHDRVAIAMTSRQFDSLPLLARDQWPAR